jgi:hypothetical protein
MRPRIVPLQVSLAVALAVFASTATATSVSGTLGPQYGTPLAMQTSQSDVGGLGDPSWRVDTNGGSQLDAAYGYVSNGTLYLFFAGSLTFWLQLEGGITHWLPLDVFIDCAPGGQQRLLADYPTIEPGVYDLKRMAGLTFDAGFDADYWLSLGGGPAPFSWPHLQAYFAALPTAGGGGGAFLGATLPGAPGVLFGGTNPSGIQVTLDDGNQIGLGSGCGAPTPGPVTTGIEWAIPLAAIGDPTGCIRVCAFVADQDHAMISNQVMGPIPPGTCSLTPAAATDFSSAPGDQFFTICPAATPARHGSWGVLKVLYR